MRKGSITVFLALVLTLLFSFVYRRKRMCVPCVYVAVHALRCRNRNPAPRVFLAPRCPRRCYFPVLGCVDMRVYRVPHSSAVLITIICALNASVLRVKMKTRNTEVFMNSNNIIRAAVRGSLAAAVSLGIFISSAVGVRADSFGRLVDEGFPPSYAHKLASLAEAYPNWRFEPLYITGMNSAYTFSYVLNKQTADPSTNLVSPAAGNAAYRDERFFV